MSTVSALASSEASAPGPFAPTRSNYERFSLLLLRTGRVPGRALSHLDFRVLLFLLGQKPEHYAAHHHTIAAACNSNVTSVKQALGRLRAAGLVLWELVPPHHRLPTGRYTRTNVNRYWVHLPALAALLETPAVGRKSDPSTGPKSASPHGTVFPSERTPPPTPPDPPPAKPEQSAREEEADSPISSSSEHETVRASWEKLGLGALDGRAMRALENRRIEGATLEQVEAAILGAGADEWVRRRAKVPFAVVFASVASIERFAHEGRKILETKAAAVRRENEERQKDRQWREQLRSAEDALPPPCAERLRDLLPAVTRTVVRAEPLSPADLERRKLDQLARAQAWILAESRTE